MAYTIMKLGAVLFR